MTHFEGDNIGSIRKLEYCPHYGFSSFNPAVLAAGFSWLEIPFKDESCQLFLKIRDTDQGILYSYSGPFTIHHQRDEVESALFPYVGKHLIFRLTDMNGRVYIIGLPGSPTSLNIDTKTGIRFTDENGSSFVFEIDQTVKAFSI